MVAPIGINTNAYSQANAMRNMQQVGGQSQVTRRQDVDPSAAQDPKTQSADQVQFSDGVSFSKEAQENATHVGAAQNEADDSQKVGEDLGTPAEGSQGVEEPVADGTTPGADETKTEPQKDEYGFVLLDDEGNPIGGSVPPPEEGAGETPPAGEGPQGPHDPFGPNGPTEAERMAYYQTLENDRQQALSILTQMQADRAKWMTELWKILSDTQNAMFDIMQEAMINRASTFDRAMHGWSRVFRGG